MANVPLSPYIISPMYARKINLGYQFPELEILEAAEFFSTTNETESKGGKNLSYASSVLLLWNASFADWKMELRDRNRDRWRWLKKTTTNPPDYARAAQTTPHIFHFVYASLRETQRRKEKARVNSCLVRKWAYSHFPLWKPRQSFSRSLSSRSPCPLWLGCQVRVGTASQAARNKAVSHPWTGTDSKQSDRRIFCMLIQTERRYWQENSTSFTPPPK